MSLLLLVQDTTTKGLGLGYNETILLALGFGALVGFIIGYLIWGLKSNGE